jgi:hypothetical protein
LNVVAPAIKVHEVPDKQGYRFLVNICEGESTSNHEVTMSAGALAALGGHGCQPERLVDAAIRFLLDREAKESILAKFDINVIGSYFPEFERALPGYLTENASRQRPGR